MVLAFAAGTIPSLLGCAMIPGASPEPTFPDIHPGECLRLVRRAGTDQIESIVRVDCGPGATDKLVSIVDNGDDWCPPDSDSFAIGYTYPAWDAGDRPWDTAAWRFCLARPDAPIPTYPIPRSLDD